MLGGVFVFETKVLLCSLKQTASILRQSPQSRDSGCAPPRLAVNPSFYALLSLLSHSLPFQILPTSHRTNRIPVFCYYSLGTEITTSPFIGITWHGHGYRTHLKAGFLHQRVSEFMTVTPQGTCHSTPCSSFLSSTPGYLLTTHVLGERKAETLFPMFVPKTTPLHKDFIEGFTGPSTLNFRQCLLEQMHKGVPRDPKGKTWRRAQEDPYIDFLLLSPSQES